MAGAFRVRFPPVSATTEPKPLAGRQGLEPRFIGPEPIVLPLNDLPVGRNLRQGAAKGGGCYMAANAMVKT